MREAQRCGRGRRVSHLEVRSGENMEKGEASEEAGGFRAGTAWKKAL